MTATPKPIVETVHPSAEIYEQSSARRWIIAFSVMLGTILEVLDSSIVNVSLPHMQGSFSASVDEIAWVITSYLVAAGIMICVLACCAIVWTAPRCTAGPNLPALTVGTSMTLSGC